MSKFILNWSCCGKNPPTAQIFEVSVPALLPPFGLMGPGGERRGHRIVPINTVTGQDSDPTTSRGLQEHPCCQAQAFSQCFPKTGRENLAGSKAGRSKEEFFDWRSRQVTLSQSPAFLCPGCRLPREVVDSPSSSGWCPCLMQRSWT